jgi:hypothetical protein
MELPTRRFRGALRAAMVALAGAVAALAMATPAHADGPTEPKAINDGEARCTPTGDIVLPWHFIGLHVNLTEVTSVPAGLVFISGNGPWDSYNTVAWQLIPGGSTSASLTFSWIDVDNASHTGTTTSTTTQQMPTGCEPLVSAEFKSNCDHLVDVTVHNDSEDKVPFTANGVTKSVNADSSAVIENVPAQDDGSVDVTMDWLPNGNPFLTGLPVDTYTWKDPGGCPTPTPSPTGTSNSSLPLTGSSVTGVIAVGGGLLAAGALLVVVSLLVRRRRSSAEH